MKIAAFCQGAEAAGHQVEVFHVGKMKINGCLGCEYCHGKGEGKCIQNDDMEKIMPAYLESDMIVFASPLYYFAPTAQLEAAMQRSEHLLRSCKQKRNDSYGRKNRAPGSFLPGALKQGGIFISRSTHHSR